MSLYSSGRKAPYLFRYSSWSTQERAVFKEANILMIKTAGVAILTWSFVTGIAMAKSGMLLSQVLGMSFFVYAGSAQLASIPLILENMPFWSIWLTATIVNLRFVIFSASLREHFSDVSKVEKAWLGFFNPDICFALFTQRYPEPSNDAMRLPFFWGLSFANWLLWQLGSVAGILLAIQIPQSWNISFAGVLALIVITLPMIDHGFARFAALAAAIVAVLTYSLPYKLNIVCAVVAAILVGMSLDRDKKPSLKVAKSVGIDQKGRHE